MIKNRLISMEQMLKKSMHSNMQETQRKTLKDEKINITGNKKNDFVLLVASGRENKTYKHCFRCTVFRNVSLS